MMLSEAFWRSAGELERQLREAGYQSCFIGGVALQRWGEPRFTRDLDLTLFTGFGHEQVYIDALLQLFEPRLEGARGSTATWSDGRSHR
jgi:hypothetical protein